MSSSFMAPVQPIKAFCLKDESVEGDGKCGFPKSDPDPLVDVAE